jgi:hypothetical protein
MSSTICLHATGKPELLRTVYNVCILVRNKYTAQEIG